MSLLRCCWYDYLSACFLCIRVSIRFWQGQVDYFCYLSLSLDWYSPWITHLFASFFEESTYWYIDWYLSWDTHSRISLIDLYCFVFCIKLQVSYYLLLSLQWNWKFLFSVQWLTYSDLQRSKFVHKDLHWPGIKLRFYFWSNSMRTHHSCKHLHQQNIYLIAFLCLTSLSGCFRTFYRFWSLNMISISPDFISRVAVCIECSCWLCSGMKVQPNCFHQMTSTPIIADIGSKLCRIYVFLESFKVSTDLLIVCLHGQIRVSERL